MSFVMMPAAESFAEFQDILRDYENLRENYVLPKTDVCIKLYRKNTLTYLDIECLLSILKEIYGNDIPKEMKNHIKHIFFVERILVEEDYMEKMKDLICTRFIDISSFASCEYWINQCRKQLDTEEQMFQRISLNSPVKNYLNDEDVQISNAPTSNDIKCHFPLGDFWSQHDVDEILKSAQETSLPFRQSKVEEQVPYIKPRGKQMPRKKVNAADRPFACNVTGCNRAFKRFEHLKRHMKMHTGERPFKCKYPGCDRAFSRSDNLNAHYKTHANSSSSGGFGNFAIFDKY